MTTDGVVVLGTEKPEKMRFVRHAVGDNGGLFISSTDPSNRHSCAKAEIKAKYPQEKFETVINMSLAKGI